MLSNHAEAQVQLLSLKQLPTPTHKKPDATRGDGSGRHSSLEKVPSPGEDYEQMAVAKLMQPTIFTAVVQALKQGLAGIREEITSHLTHSNKVRLSRG